MRDHLPKLYDKISWVVEAVPYKEASPAYPFTGFVININVRTQGHRDGMDHDSCLVMALGDFEGAEICLYEPRLVFELKNGDFVIFPSQKITHFNTDFTGIRGSLVCHSDSALAQSLRDKTHRGYKGNPEYEQQRSGYIPES